MGKSYYKKDSGSLNPALSKKRIKDVTRGKENVSTILLIHFINFDLWAIKNSGLLLA